MAGGSRSAAVKKAWITRRRGGPGMAELRAEARNLAVGANRSMRRGGIKARAWPKGLLEQVHGSAISRNSAVNAALLRTRKRSDKSTSGWDIGKSNARQDSYWRRVGGHD
jgi:hypothetical protein